ncbi:MAG: PQQ-binding-like beta-propeller repeat protein [Pirellulales bacterium]
MKTVPQAVLLCLFTTIGSADDWPTYRHDRARSGATSDRIEMPLENRWTYSATAAPRRTWSGAEGRTVEGNDLFDRVKFDDAIQAVMVGNRVYFGSSVDHQIYCLDADSGAVVWRAGTNAPVRLAPTVFRGRVYVGSDDGYVYCLDAKSGKPVWTLRVGPANEWIIGRGEMISRWPVRTSVLIDDDVAYFGAGVFPHENVYLCAVNAVNGEIIWRNDNISHQNAGRNELSPQGYLLATAEKLFVPSGRSQPRAVDRKTGKLSGANAASLLLSAGRVAGTEAIVIDKRLFTPSLGSQLAGTGDATYVTTGAALARSDRTKFGQLSKSRKVFQNELRQLGTDYRRSTINKTQYQQQAAAVRQRLQELEEKSVVWRTPSSANSAVIVTAEHAFAGGKGEVSGFEIATGRKVWDAKVDGEARGLAAANGHLLVSTTTGKIYCFGKGKTSVVKNRETAGDKFKVSAVADRAVTAILAATNIKRGFCLVLGCEDSHLALELAKRTELNIYCIEPNAAKVAAARKLISTAGYYGHRVTVHHGQLNGSGYPSYFANLILSESHLQTGQLVADPAQIVRLLKPAGGIVWLGQPQNVPNRTPPAAYTDWLMRMQLGDAGQLKEADTWAMLTRGTLPGAGNWTHQYAEPGNTANSGDKLVGGGLGVLWYGDPGPGMMVNRHQGAVGPLVVDGRLFVQGTDHLMAYDAYNGLPLWKVENPGAIRTGVFQNRTPGNLAASVNYVFHMVRGNVDQHDAATGKVVAQHKLPPTIDAKTHEWGYVAHREGLLFGTSTTRKVVQRERRRRGDPGATATDAIFAIDVETGKHLWNYQGSSINFQTIALGPGRVYFIDSSVTAEQRAAILREDKSELQQLTGEARKRAEARIKSLDIRLAVALDAKTGKEIWSKPVDVTDCSEIGIGGGKLTLMFRDGVLVLCGANANGHYWKQFMAGEFSRRRLVALRTTDGYRLWAKDANYRHRPIIVGDKVIAEPWSFDLTSGQQIMRKHPVTGLEVPWSIMRPGHHCGMLTACDNMLMFRSGYTGFYDLAQDSGTRHFAGHRLGCWINAIPTNGLVVIPEASAGCVCMFSIASTIVMEPRPARRPWSLVSAVGPTTPVKRLALNFGAPGDRRDSGGAMWLAWPRSVPNTGLETSLDLKLNVKTTLVGGGRFFSNDGDAVERDKSHLRWVASSGARGLQQLSLPLLGKDDKAADYAVRLFFRRPNGGKAIRVRVRMQGNEVIQDLELAEAQTKSSQTVVREVRGVSVQDNLVIEFAPAAGDADSSLRDLVISGVEVFR